MTPEEQAMKSPAIDVTIATYYRCGCGAVLTAGEAVEHWQACGAVVDLDRLARRVEALATRVVELEAHVRAPKTIHR